MPIEMSESELEIALKSATKIDTFEFRNEEDEDDFIMASLYKDAEGQFRVIDQAGMNHARMGEFNTGERLTQEEAKSWTSF